ncbi:MAG TPA: hypothetical protein VFZ06_10250 [Acidimicrobiia bacterium]|nr:hypothetical protein [Acidimicrobiia bacterium]
MGQQPNVEIGGAEAPRSVPEPGPARRWRPTRPGVITSPTQVPRGGAFGTPGPDTGYALRIIRSSPLELTTSQEKVIAALMAARSSHKGRAPVREDLDVALVLAGIGDGLPTAIVERGEQWAAATAHEVSAGRRAVADAGTDLFEFTADEVRRRLRLLGY